MQRTLARIASATGALALAAGAGRCDLLRLGAGGGRHRRPPESVSGGTNAESESTSAVADVYEAGATPSSRSP